MHMGTHTQLQHLPRGTMIAPAAPIRRDSEARPPTRAAGKQQDPTMGSAAPWDAVQSAPERYHARQHTVALAGLQLLLGYEWLVSGLDKLQYATFPVSVGQLLAGALQGGKVPAPFAAF